MNSGGSRGLKRVWLALGWILCLGCSGGERAAEIEAAGRLLGLSFSKELPPEWASAIREMPSIRARELNFFPGALVSDDALVFDWTWRKRAPKDRTRVNQTVVAVRFREGGLPVFTWTERGQLSKQDLRVSGDLLDFEDVPEFSDRFDVAGRDRTAIRALFDTAHRERLQLPDGLRVEGHGEWLIGYRVGELAAPEEVEARLREMQGLRDSMR